MLLFGRFPHCGVIGLVAADLYDGAADAVVQDLVFSAQLALQNRRPGVLIPGFPDAGAEGETVADTDDAGLSSGIEGFQLEHAQGAAQEERGGQKDRREKQDFFSSVERQTPGFTIRVFHVCSDTFPISCSYHITNERIFPPVCCSPAKITKETKKLLDTVKEL